MRSAYESNFSLIFFQSFYLKNKSVKKTKNKTKTTKQQKKNTTKTKQNKKPKQKKKKKKEQTNKQNIDVINALICHAPLITTGLIMYGWDSSSHLNSIKNPTHLI